MAFPNIPLLKKQISSGERKTPIHVAINTGKIKTWITKNGKDEKEALARHIELVKMLIDKQLKHKFPILTISLPVETEEEIKATTRLFDELSKDEQLHSEKVRIFVIGQWYDIDHFLVDSIKNMMAATKEFDSYFINFCVNYDGQDEILGAVRLIAKKVSLGKLKPDEIDLDVFKENMYTSYFTPPDLIIETFRRYSGLLLWDAKKSRIKYTGKLWLDFTAVDFDNILLEWQKV